MATGAALVTYSSLPDSTFTVQNSCLIDSLSIIDSQTSQTLSSLHQVGYQGETSLTWDMNNSNTYTGRKDTSYVCPTIKVAITLVAMIYPDGSSSTNFISDQQGGTTSSTLDFASLRNMPVLVTTDSKLVFSPTKDDEIATYNYTVAIEQDSQ